jgi:hypothetical protein
MVKSAESQIFPRIILRKVKAFRGSYVLRKGMLFRRVIRGKSNLSEDYPAERHAFPQDNSRKVKTFRGSYVLRKGMLFRRVIRGKSKLSANFPAKSFSKPRKVKISLFKGLSILPQMILDKKSTVGDQYYLRFERKN